MAEDGWGWRELRVVGDDSVRVWLSVDEDLARRISTHLRESGRSLDDLTVAALGAYLEEPDRG